MDPFDHPFHLGGVIGVILGNGGHQLRHQDIVDLFGLQALESQVQVTHDGLQRGPGQENTLGHEETEERLYVPVDLLLEDGHVPAADQGQVLHQVGMEGPADLQQNVLLLGPVGQRGKTLYLLQVA